MDYYFGIVDYVDYVIGFCSVSGKWYSGDCCRGERCWGEWFRGE